jgi:hypothetical protein
VPTAYDRVKAKATCVAHGEDLRALFDLGRRLADAGQRAILANTVDLTVELARRTGLQVVVSDACQGDPEARIKRLAEQLFERCPGIRLVFQIPDRAALSDEISRSDSVFTFSSDSTPPRVKAVIDMATLADGLTGSVDQIDLMDFLQLLLMKRGSGALAVQGSETSGLIIVVDGEIVDARCGGLRGNEAAVHMLAQRRGRFQEMPLPQAIERTIQVRSDFLLLEAMRLRDERDNDRAAPAGVPNAGR